MPNTSIPAAGEAMPAAEAKQTIYLLLSTYWQRMDDLTEAMRRTDDTAHDTAEHEEAFDAQREVGEQLNESERAIAAYEPEWRHEAKIKTDFLIYLAAGNHGTLSDDVVAALLGSLPRLVRRAQV